MWAPALAASGQTPSRLSVTPAVGSFDPRGELPGAPILNTGSVLEYADFEPVLALGAALEWRAASFLDLRVRAMRSRESAETGQWGCGPNRAGNPVPCVHAEYGELRSREPEAPVAPARLTMWTLGLEVPLGGR